MPHVRSSLPFSRFAALLKSLFASPPSPFAHRAAWCGALALGMTVVPSVHAQSYGDTGGGIIYYGNGTVVTNPPPNAAPTYAAPSANNAGGGSVTSQGDCPVTQFPNPPAPCANPSYGDPYGYGYGGAYGYGWGATVYPDYPAYAPATPARTPSTPRLPTPVERPPTGAGSAGTTSAPSTRSTGNVPAPSRQEPAPAPRSSTGGVMPTP